MISTILAASHGEEQNDHKVVVLLFRADQTLLYRDGSFPGGRCKPTEDTKIIPQQYSHILSGVGDIQLMKKTIDASGQPLSLYCARINNRYPDERLLAAGLCWKPIAEQSAWVQQHHADYHGMADCTDK